MFLHYVNDWNLICFASFTGNTGYPTPSTHTHCAHTRHRYCFKGKYLFAQENGKSMRARAYRLPLRQREGGNGGVLYVSDTIHAEFVRAVVVLLRVAYVMLSMGELRKLR